MLMWSRASCCTEEIWGAEPGEPAHTIIIIIIIIVIIVIIVIIMCTHQASTWSEGRGDRQTSALIELHHSSLRMHLREGSIFVEIVETDYHRMYNWTGSMCRVAETVLGLCSPLCPGQHQTRVPRRLETSQCDHRFWRELGGLNDKVEHCTALSWLLCSPFICESITSLIKLEDALPESRNFEWNNEKWFFYFYYRFRPSLHSWTTTPVPTHTTHKLHTCDNL